MLIVLVVQGLHLAVGYRTSGTDMNTIIFTLDIIVVAEMSERKVTL